MSFFLQLPVSLSLFNFVLLVTYPQFLFLTLLSSTVHYVLPVLNTALYILFPCLFEVFTVLYWFWCSQTTRVILNSPLSFLISDITLIFSDIYCLKQAFIQSYEKQGNQGTELKWPQHGKICNN